MSKIARIYQGTNEIQKYYQGGVLQRLFFDWKHYIGNELNIEYGKECAGRNVVISGKTYQNLFKAELSQGYVDGSVMSQNKRVNSDGFTLDSTTYTICVPSGYEVLVYKNFESNSSVYIGWANKLVWTNSATTNNIRIMIRRADDGELTVDEAIGKVILLKGDYTNIDLPTSIDGIESIGEKEGNLVTIRNYNYKCETDNIVLPNNTKNEISYSNGKHIHTRKIGKYIISGGSNETISIRKDLAGSEYITFNVDVKSNMEKAFIYYEDSKQKMICDKLEISLDEFKDWVKKITKEAICMRGSGLGFCISILRSKLETEDADGFRTWLSNNPITVYYELYSFVDTDLYYDDITYKLDEPLRSLPNGICDTIEENKLVQRVGKDIIDGTQDLKLDTYNTIQTSRVYFAIDNAKNSKGNNNLLCNWFIREGDHGDYEYIIIQQYAPTKNAVFISVLNSKLGSADLNGMKKYFAENPLPFYYELETPIETEITPDMILINGEPITDTVGIELPNGTKDSIENGCYVKRVGKVIIDGKNGTYQKSGTSTSTLNVYVVRKLGINITLKGMNTNYIYQCDSEIDMSKYITVGKWLSDSTSGSVVFKVPTEEYLWSDIHNAFLENPITLYVELATPIKIPLFSIKEGLTILKSTNNITPQIELDCLVRDDFQNMCDNAWEAGFINFNTGVNEVSTSTIRLINNIQVKSNTTYRIDITNLVQGNNGDIAVRYYDISKTYINGNAIGNIGNAKANKRTFTTPKDCYYIRFIVETTDTNFKIYLKEVIN